MTNVAWTATRIAALMNGGDVVFLADDDQHAEALAMAVRALCPTNPVFYLPASDALPGDSAPASPGNIGARMATLRAFRLSQAVPDRMRITVALSGEAAARRYPSPEAFDNARLRLAIGDQIDLGELSEKLAAIGYVADDRADQPGEMATRGEVLDIFPTDAGLPARIDMADGRITAIRSYDPATQLGVGVLDTLEIEQACEIPLDCPTTILRHVAPGAILFSNKAETRRRRFLELASDVARGQQSDIDAIDDSLWTSTLSKWHIVTIDALKPVPRFAEARSPLAALARFVAPLLNEGRALVLAGSSRDLRFLRPRVARRLGCELASLDSWENLGLLAPGMAGSIEMRADEGFVDDHLILITATDLLGSRALVGEQQAAVANPWAMGGEIHLGDVVIHEDHGVGVVSGLEPAPLVGQEGEMIALEYSGGARRLVSPDDAERIWRYGADADAVTLDKLDGSSWAKRHGVINAAIEESARGLAELAEVRRQLVAPVIDPDPAAYERFARGFPFNETADQARAISAVRDDLARGRPMDRLVVGDVGYGKTEVALRAAALAALSGYQSVIAAPTTVLVRQHLESFRRRFAASGIAVAGLSRLSSAAEKKAVKAGLADGSIAIVIGTGAVMAKSVSYARLGLVVIDEEQRFGAADKARLRGSGEIHLLTLSATPIPRTLQMALVGLQQISVIATPPARRQPIRTRLDHYDDGPIRTALLREKSRGGQSFVVVPRIEDMAPLAQKLRRLLPDLDIVEAHGKMPAADIDVTMVGFAQGDGDILLATNIIEAGLDVPRANTMIVWRADRFGLAQLHQLRGRVGRGNRRGEVILLTDGGDAIGERTMKRLRTLASFDRLGAGFDISAQDLDMRGAGDLLGETQAGHMKLIGVELYQHLLATALRAAQGEVVERWTPELNLGRPGALPDSWIPNADVRLTLYIRLARIAEEARLDAFEDELIDRFGALPEPAVRLLAQTRLRLTARAARIARVDAGPAAIALTPRREFDADPAAHGLVEKNNRLLLAEITTDEDRTERVQALLEALAA